MRLLLKHMAVDCRLALAAALVRRGKVAADIGTDHAKLVIDLVRRGICPRAIAADINPQPAWRAVENIRRHGLQQLIEVRVGDGLTPLRPEEAQDIVIAGMGGENIARIVLAAKWLRTDGYKLILQPMSRDDALRISLAKNGFAIITEHFAKDCDRLYCIMTAEYDPQKAANQLQAPAFEHLGAINSADALSAQWIHHRLQKLKRQYAAQINDAERYDLKKMKAVINALEKF